MFIKNFEELAKSPLHRQALRIAESALDALDAKKAIEKTLKLQGDMLVVPGKNYDLSRGKVYLVAFGKVALEGARAVYDILSSKIACGFVLDVRDGEVGEKVVCRVGTHPQPTVVNVNATEEMISMLSGLSPHDLVVTIVSGGGSSLLCSPKSISCDLQARVEHELTKQGADIVELNTVRKHLSKVKGGNLALRLAPAQILGLVFSDVPNGGLDLVASGPTVLDSTTVHDAKKVLDKYSVLEKLNINQIELSETPKLPSDFEHVHNILVVSAQAALVGAAEKAKELGWQVQVVQESFSGEANLLGKEFASKAKDGFCVLAAGESTVKLGASFGEGGRNQELALSASLYMPKQSVLIALASDGYDNTEFAGAVVDSDISEAGKQIGVDAEDKLMSHDTYNFFKYVGGGIVTGRTGMNIADLIILLTE